MKLICEEALRPKLEDALKSFAHLSITLVQKGCPYEAVCIQFDPQHLEELFVILKQFDTEHLPPIIAYQEKRMYLIDPLTIVYVEGYRREAYLHTLTASYELPYRLYEIEEQLSTLGFLRINKSTIVNLRMVDSIVPAFHACYTMELKNGIAVECSRKYWKLCKEKLKLR